MKFSSTTIPSVIERYNQPLISVSASPEKKIQLYETGVGYLIGDLALAQGVAPYRNINSAPADIDYQLLAKAALLVASEAKSGEVVVTTGFPYTTFEIYKQQAEDFFSLRDIFVEFNNDTFLTNEHKRIQFTANHVEIMPEILGCINAIRKGPVAEQDSFFIVSLGYGTCETGLSTDTGLIGRTCMSVSGLRHAVNNMRLELSRSFNLGMKNEHMINQSFQTGKIVINRKKKDLTEIRRNQLENYYHEVISTTLKKAFNDTDFEKAEKMYLVGGGALYPELVECFKNEFDGVLDIIVPPDAANMASIGYCLRSLQWCGPANADKAVGLDIGNAYTVVTQAKATKPAAATQSTETKPAA
jgi:actin-like ATPase involved in cell morphogenesis